MGRPKKFATDTKVVGFRVPIEQANDFKQNIYSFLPDLLTASEDLSSDILKQDTSTSKWTDDDIKYMMGFFQRNKANLKLTNEDRKFFENIIKRATKK